MEFRYLGNSGFKISAISYGNWITHGSQVEEDAANACVKRALDLGITTFDTADVYAGTRAEEVLGRALAGVIAYRNDPRRNPDYTKFPATWLNNDSWENAAVTPEARVRIEKERQASVFFIKEQEELAKQAAPPPKCEHGKTVALCTICLRG